MSQRPPDPWDEIDCRGIALDRVGKPLFHYCCDHSAALIAADGLVRPTRQYWRIVDGSRHPQPCGLALAWFTDMHPPVPEALGLTMKSIACDRTRHRFTARDPGPLVWWPHYRRDLADEELKAGARMLEAAPGAMPAHWWVSTTNVPVDG